MNDQELAKLKPLAQTGPEIRASLGRIEGAKTSLQSRLTDTSAELAEKERTFTLSSATRRKIADVIADIEQDLQMLAFLASQVEAPLANVEMVERDARLGADRVALRADMATVDANWQAEYPALHAALDKLLAERAKLLARAEAHNMEAINVFRPIDLAEFRLPTEEVRLLKSQAQRAEDAIPLHQRQAIALKQTDDARRAAREANGPRSAVDAAPKPTLTVGGELQDITGKTWK